MEHICTDCGQIAEYKTGNKNGKNWAGYFCTDPNCKHVEWIQLHASTNGSTQSPKPAPKPEVKNGVSTDMMRLAYRKDLMVAIINAGLLNDAQKIFEELWKIIEP